MKKIAALLMALTMALSVTACSGDTTSTADNSTTSESSESSATTASTGETSGEGLTIAYVTSALTTQIFRDQVQAMQDYCDEQGINFMYTAQEQTEKQLEAIEQLHCSGR